MQFLLDGFLSQKVDLLLTIKYIPLHTKAQEIID